MKIEKWILAATPCWEQENYDFPNIVAPMERRETSLSETVELFDGSEAIIVPQIKSREEPYDFAIFEADVTDELLSKIRGYQQNMTGIRITLPNGEKLEGYIMGRLSWQYTTSGSAWRKALTVPFKPFDVDGSGGIGD